MGESCGQPSCGAAGSGYCAAAGDVGAGALSHRSGNPLHGDAGGKASHGGGGVADQPGEAVAVIAVLSRTTCVDALAACVAAEPNGGWRAQRGFGRYEDETLELREQHCGLGRGL